MGTEYGGLQTSSPCPGAYPPTWHPATQPPWRWGAKRVQSIMSSFAAHVPLDLWEVAEHGDRGKIWFSGSSKGTKVPWWMPLWGQGPGRSPCCWMPLSGQDPGRGPCSRNQQGANAIPRHIPVHFPNSPGAAGGGNFASILKVGTLRLHKKNRSAHRHVTGRGEPGSECRPQSSFPWVPPPLPCGSPRP